MPKVIDFGVAKATTQALTARTLHTEIGALIGTPEYMSPEQAEMEALPVTIEVLESERRFFGEDHPQALTDLHNLATIYDALGRYGEAEPLYLKAVDAKRRVLGSEHPGTARTLVKLASMYMKQQRYPEAESAFLAAYLGYAKNVGGENADTRRVIRSLAEMYVATGQPTKATEWQAKLPKVPSPKP
jgi:tetratricopeptide (TPR) repeat protein